MDEGLPGRVRVFHQQSETLKEDRQRLLNRLTAIERLSEFLGMAPQQEAEGLPLLVNQIQSLENDLERHVEKEEQGLFPLMIDMEKDQGSEFIIPLITEHCDLEKNCDELDRALRGLHQHNGESHHWQVLKIIGRIRDLCELVRDHLETELKQFFPHILDMLDPGEQAWAAEHMNAIQTRR